MTLARCSSVLALALLTLAACGDIREYPDAGGGDDDVDGAAPDIDAAGGDTDGAPDPDATPPDAMPTDGPTIDAPPPTATILTGVAEGAATNDTTPRWTFSTTGSPATIECRVETVIYGPCTTDYTAPTLTAGNHTFTIRLADAAGNQTTVTRNFSIDVTPPTLTLGTVPTSPNALSQVTYTWTSGGGVTLTECRALYQQNVVPVPAWETCSSPHTAATFNHAGTITLVFDVRVRDAAGNITPAQDTFSHYVVQ